MHDFKIKHIYALNNSFLVALNIEELALYISISQRKIKK